MRFFKKSIQIADYIAFVQPISQLNNNLQMYEFDLIGSLDLGLCHFTDRDLHCCFNIYARPKEGLNKKPDLKLQDVQIIEYRRGNTSFGNKDRIPLGHDYAMCNWGNSSLGKTPSFIGEYAQEVYIYVKNKELVDSIKEALSFDKIREYTKSVSMKRISVMRLYKYLRETVEGIK